MAAAGAPPASGWALRLAAASGLMALTGEPDGPPLAPPAGLVPVLTELVAAIGSATANAGRPVTLSWEQVVAGRAGLLGLARRGRQSANGTARLVPAADGWLALSLARVDDIDAVGALVAPWGTRVRPAGDPWDRAWLAVAGAAAHASAWDMAARARLLGMAAAPVPRPGTGAQAGPAQGRAGLGPDAGGGGVPQDPAGRSVPWRRVQVGLPTAPRPLPDVLVVDLSALWAGPLACAVLAGAGATVVKVELAGRPDGARCQPEVYRWLHPADQPEVTVDVSGAPGRRRLRQLLAAADVVVESARPRALAQLGVGPHQVPGRPGRVWLSITGHGRRRPGAHWVAFGDDAAAAGGLVAWGDSGPAFVGDALADPLTGLWGALAVLRSAAVGGGCLVDLPMAAAAAVAAGPRSSWPPWRWRAARPAVAGTAEVQRAAPPAGGATSRVGTSADAGTGWVVVVDGAAVPVAPPPRPSGFVAGAA